MTTTEPRVRIAQHVHYTSYSTPGGEYGKACRAAIVTELDDGTPDAPGDRDLIGLAVVNPTGLFFRSIADGGCRHDGVSLPKIEPGPSGRVGGTWHLMDDCG
jgi:hypothetical protein